VFRLKGRNASFRPKLIINLVLFHRQSQRYSTSDSDAIAQQHLFTFTLVIKTLAWMALADRFGRKQERRVVFDLMRKVLHHRDRTLRHDD